jgi:hypothetical protein
MNFVVRSTDRRFLDLLRRYIGRFRLDEPAGPEVRFSADCGQERTMPGGKVVRGRRKLYLGILRIYDGRLDDEMAARLIGLVRRRATMLTNEFVRVRAGAVTVNGGAVLLPSMPEPHLPTMVGMMVRSGAGYLGDEEVNVDPVLRRIHSLSLPLRIDSEHLGRFPELRGRDPRRGRPPRPMPEELRAHTPRRVVAPDELGGREDDPAPIGWIVFPSFQPGAETRLEPFGGAEALFRFTQALLNLDIWEDRALVLMRDILESSAVSTLVVGSEEEAADLLMRTAPSLVEGVTA